jgi:hypothetical protein
MAHDSGWVRRQRGVLSPVMRPSDAVTALATVLGGWVSGGARRGSTGPDLGPLGPVWVGWALAGLVPCARCAATSSSLPRPPPRPGL